MLALSGTDKLGGQLVLRGNLSGPLGDALLFNGLSEHSEWQISCKSVFSCVHLQIEIQGGDCRVTY